MALGAFSSNIGAPEGAFERFVQKPGIDPASRLAREIIEGDQGGNVLWATVRADGTLYAADGMRTPSSLGEGKYRVYLEDATSISGGNVQMAVVATPVTIAEAGSNEVTFKDFSDTVPIAGDTGAGNTQWFYSSVTNKIYVLGYDTAMIYVHDLDDFVAIPGEIDPGDPIRTPAEGSGCLSREGTFLWLSGNTTPYSVRAVDLSDGTVYDFGTTSDYRVVAAYNDGTNECVLIRDSGGLSKFTPNFGTLAFGSAVCAWTPDPFASFSQIGLWDNSDLLWFFPTAGAIQVDPDVNTTYYSYAYSGGYANETLPTYDSTRNVFYLQMVNGTSHNIYKFSGWNPVVSNTGVFTMFVNTVEYAGLYHDATSDILYAAGRTGAYEQGVRYRASDGQVIDTISIDNIADENPHSDQTFRGNQIYYADDTAWIYGSYPGIQRMRYFGQTIEYFLDENIVSGALAPGPCIYVPSTDEVWFLDPNYEEIPPSTGFYRYRIGIYSVADGTFEYISGDSTYQIYAGVDVNTFLLLDAQDIILVAGKTYGGVGFCTSVAFRISDRTNLGNWFDPIDAISPGTFSYDCFVVAVDITNSKVFVKDEGGGVVYVYALSGSPWEPTSYVATLTFTHTPIGSSFHVDNSGNLWTDADNYWMKATPAGTITSYLTTSDDDNTTQIGTTVYDASRNSIYYSSNSSPGKLKKIDCDDGTISTLIAEYPAWVAHSPYQERMSFDATLDKILILEGGGGNGFSLYLINPDSGAMDRMNIPDTGNSHFNSQWQFAVKPGVAVWSFSTIGTGSGVSGLGRVLTEVIGAITVSDDMNLDNAFFAVARILGTNRVRVDTFRVGVPPIRANCAFSVHVGVK